MGVVFFPSLPFMGVMLFPSFALGNASGEGGVPLAPFSPFSVLFSLPLLSSPSPSFSFFSTSHSSFSLSFRTNSCHPFLLFSSFPSLSFPFPSFLPPSSALSFPSPSFFFFPEVFFFFLGNYLYQVSWRCKG